MSLFGNSPPASPGGGGLSTIPLFGDDTGLPPGGNDILRSTSQPVTGGGLFDNDGPGGLFDDDLQGSGGVWSILPPRSRSVGPTTSTGIGGITGGAGPTSSATRRENLVKSLLTEGNSNLPPAYAELYERVLADYPAGEGGFEAAPGVNLQGVRKVLEDGGVGEHSDVGRRIREAVVGGGEVVGRQEFFVLLAMVGLAQEAEDVSIDGVDDRRRNLPIPKLQTYPVQQPYMALSEAGFESRDTERATPDTSTASSHHQHPELYINHSDVHGSTSEGGGGGAGGPYTPTTTTTVTAKPPPTTNTTTTTTATPGNSKPTPTSPVAARTSNSYSRPGLPDAADQDIWGSPTLHSGHGHGHGASSSTNTVTASHAQAASNGYSIPPANPVMITGGFANPPEEDEHEPDDLQAALRAHSNAAAAGLGGVRHSSSSAWGVYDGAAGSQVTGRVNTGVLSGYGGVGGESIRGPGTNRMGSFGGLGGGSLSAQRGAVGGARPGAGLGSGARFEDTVTVTVLPEKEGMFLFQHRNYQISSGRRGSRVVRRYSDFVWLLDCLHKRYPFRCLPLLPPKRIAVNGNYLSADSTFLDNRRRGLVRFTNFLIRHPVLSQEQLVIMFLTVPTELSVWRKQASISVQDEFTTRLQTLTPLQVREIEASLPPDLEQTFETVRSGLRKSAEIYIGLCALVERLGRRQEGLAGEYARFAVALDSLTDVSEATYAVDTNDIPLLNDGLGSVARHLTNTQTLLVDEARAWDEGLLEDLKRQRDGLVAMRELFDRKDRLLSVDPIPGLEKRIATSERRLEALNAKAGVAAANGGDAPGLLPKELAEMDRLRESVVKDKKAIVEQKARRVLVRECVREELGVLHAGQYHVSRLHQDWSQERVKYAELQAENWRSLSSSVEGMPLGE